LAKQFEQFYRPNPALGIASRLGFCCTTTIFGTISFDLTVTCTELASRSRAEHQLGRIDCVSQYLLRAFDSSST